MFGVYSYAAVMCCCKVRVLTLLVAGGRCSNGGNGGLLSDRGCCARLRQMTRRRDHKNIKKNHSHAMQHMKVATCRAKSPVAATAAATACKAAGFALAVLLGLAGTGTKTGAAGADPGASPVTA